MWPCTASQTDQHYSPKKGGGQLALPSLTLLGGPDWGPGVSDTTSNGVISALRSQKTIGLQSDFIGTQPCLLEAHSC